MSDHSFPLARPINADGRQTRQAILDAALDLFADRGYFGASLRDIAAVVGVRDSALYNYFAGKDDLFNALLAADQDVRAQQWAGVMAEPVVDDRALLERVTTRILDYFRAPRQQKLFRLTLSDGMRLAAEGRFDLADRMTNCAAPLHALMRRLIARSGWQARDPEMLATAFMGPLVLWRYCHAINPRDRRVVNRRAFVRAHVEQFLEGARGVVSEAPRESFPAPVRALSGVSADRPRRRAKKVSQLQSKKESDHVA